MGASAAALLFGAFAAAGGCSSDSGGSGGGPARDPFIAFAADFASYHTWDSTPGTSPDPPESTHTMGMRTVYINKKPAHGATKFPLGTIIVKELENVSPDDAQVFAMVKRGENYNPAGALDWEWFELVNIDSKTVSIKWRGVGPPLGEKYGGDPNGGCNGCHGRASDDDYVQTTGFQLSSF